MALTAAQIATLKTEVTTDLRGYGFLALYQGGNDTGLAAALNLPRDGTNGGPAISLNRGTILAQDLVEAIVQSEMPANASQRDWLIMVASGARVRVDEGSTARAGLLAIFMAGTTTRANFLTAAVRPGSRAEELFGREVRVSADDIVLVRQS